MQVNISVVIPTYRRPQLLVRCLNALVCQHFDKNAYEIIVVSDGPDESTAGVMKQWTDTVIPVIRYIATPSKKGPAASRNAGWMNARGDLIAFTDDDCIPSANWLLSMRKAYKCEELTAFTGRVVVPRSESPTDYELNTANLETAEFVTANCILTKKALQQTGGFDERFSMAWREDSDLHFKLLQENIPICPVPAVVTHPVRKAPWGVSIRDQKKGIYNALLYKKYPGLYRQRIKPHPSWNYYAMVLAFIASLLCFGSGTYAPATMLLVCWLVLLILFTEKRLAGTSRAGNHIAEMIVTSMIIPFASVFWQLYGSLKFRVLFI